MIKLLSLKKGDVIEIISPAGWVKDAGQLNNAKDYLESKGFEVRLSPNVLAKSDYLAGDDELRLADLHEAFENPEVKAILCSRGGYGCARLLNKIDYELIERNPKIFLGHSDITAFLNNFTIPTFHSPMAVSDFGSEPDSFTEKSFFEVITGEAKQFIFKARDDFKVVNPGTAHGKLAGGNLSVICSLMGTDYAPDFNHKILLLEDLNEPLYKIDRMLTQLKLAGVFEQVSGVIFAGFGDSDVLVEFLSDFVGYKPTIYGFQASHAKDKYTLPMNVGYFLDADKGVLELKDSIFQ